jgi:AcrR family transcriptional regulator
MSELVQVAPGLRERKKLATRRALERAALRLVDERGLERVTVDEIAAEADVSTRTFFNYFPGKEQALVGQDPTVHARLLEAFEARPAEEAPLDTLRAVLTSTTDRIGDRAREWALRMRVIAANPALLPHLVAAFTETEQFLVGVVAQRTGLDPATDGYPRLLAAIVMTVLRTTMGRWSDGGFAHPLRELLDESFDQLARGLPVPDPASPRSLIPVKELT